ncbi:MAG TPA: AMP-binding protein [Steroidobacteraceae bacterium]|nr:AMP-binding protein [Steroidobacteraceae bacterium]
MASLDSRIIESPSPAIDVPATTLPRYIRALASERGHQLAIIEGHTGRRLSYAELDLQIGRVAAGLKALGFEPGDTLLMVAPNLPEWPVMALGVLAAGGVMSAANPASSTEELARQMRDVGARFVFTTGNLRQSVRAVAQAAGGATLIVVGSPDGNDVSYDALLACNGPEPQLPEAPDALAALPYSSGTTGMPKGVRLTHRTILANLLQHIAQWTEPEGTRGRCVLGCLPMYHVYGFSVLTLTTLVEGRALVTLPRFEPEMFLKAIQDFRITHLWVVPPLLRFLLQHPLVADYDLSSIKRIGCGAAPLDRDLEKRVADRMGCVVVQGFGMTESSGVITSTRPGHERAGSSGQLLPGTQARVVDPATLSDVPRGSAGEIWFRGPQAFLGYHNAPEATATTLTSDGWVRTGDIGYFDDAGYLYVTDRLKELIKVKGFQVAPSELEALLYTHPDVADAAVIGRADERCGEAPVAYIVPRRALDPDGLKEWVAQRVSAYKHLADVVVCPAIPKTASGKILRRDLRSMDAQRKEKA